MLSFDFLSLKKAIKPSENTKTAEKTVRIIGNVMNEGFIIFYLLYLRLFFLL